MTATTSDRNSEKEVLDLSFPKESINPKNIVGDQLRMMHPDFVPREMLCEGFKENTDV